MYTARQVSESCEVGEMRMIFYRLQFPVQGCADTGWVLGKINSINRGDDDDGSLYMLVSENGMSDPMLYQQTFEPYAKGGSRNPDRKIAIGFTVIENVI